MKKSASMLVLLLFLSFVLVSLPQIEEVKAQGTIYIRSNGMVEGTDKISERMGDIYTFTGNISGRIQVQRSNFLLDWAGYTLQGTWTGYSPNEYVMCKGIDLSNNRMSDPSRHKISNVTIKNMRIVNFTRGIECVNSNNHIIIGCYIVDCGRGINQPNNVLIKNNTIASGIFIDYTRGNNVITQNNMINNYGPSAYLIGVFLAPQPDVYMNYWSDYNGTDADGDGIGDTPYIINENNQDNFPLMNQVINQWFIPIEKPESFPVIYVRSDGSVEGTDKIQRDGDVYTFISDINGSIVVEKDSIVINGANFTLQGNGSGRGIELSDRKNVTVKNFGINHFEIGIYIYDYSEPRNNTISANIITNNTFGIYIEHSHNNTIFGNTIANNEYGIHFLESRFDVLRNNILSNNRYSFYVVNTNFVNDVDTSNLVDGKPMIYWVNQQDRTVPSEAGCVALINCKNITIRNLVLDNNGQGILLVSTTDSMIANNTITKNKDGICLKNSSNNTISENNLTYNNRGIRIGGSWRNYSLNNTIYGNYIANNGDGIYLFETSNNVFRNNRMINNNRSFVDITFFINDVDVSNTVDGKPFYYWVNEHDKIIPSDAGYVVLIHCTNITVQNIELANEEEGILLAYTRDSKITNNIITNNNRGVYLSNSPNNTVSGNYITNNEHGIWLSNSSNNNIVENYIANNRNGISIMLSPFFPTSSNNLIYHNNYVNNTRHIYITPPGFAIPDSINVWDNGVEGNYWSDYVGVNNNGDGLGDSPYVIDANNRDNYPLMASVMSPIYISDAGTWEWIQYNVYVVSNSTVSEFIFDPEDTMIQFNVISEIGTTGFCNVTIPKDLLHAEDNWTVLVDGNPVTPTVNEDASNTYLYFTYNHSTKTVEIIGTNAIPEFPSWTPLLIMLIAVVAVAVIYRRILNKPNEGRMDQ